MTKLLILSDSHNSRLAIENILAAEADSIDALIFLGDGLRDLEQALTFYPSLRAYAVAGNCDFGALEPLDGLAAFDGVVVFYTHGHMYGVKYDLDTLADAAAARGANVALFGHTHIPVAEERGVPVAAIALAWVLAQRGVVAPIVSAFETLHVDELVQGVGVRLSRANLAELTRAGE